MRTAAAALALLLAAACDIPEPDREQRLAYQAALRTDSSTAATAPVVADSAVLARLAEAERASGGILGVAAMHLPSGNRIVYKHREWFPMASTFKVAVALAVLARVDSGSVALDAPVTIAPSDFRLGPQPIADSVGPRGGTVTVRQLLRSMMVYSDNLATDRLMRMMGGPPAVRAHLASRGLADDIRVERSEAQMHWDFAGVRTPPPEAGWMLERFRSITAAVPRARKDSAHAAFYNDPRDQATPGAYASLMAQVARGQGLTPASQRFLLDAMVESPTGLRRIRGALPEGTVVADKTGTIGTTTNDVGLITLPDGSQMAIAVFVRASTLPTEQVEPALARAARIVYDHFAGATAAGTGASR